MPERYAAGQHAKERLGARPEAAHDALDAPSLRETLRDPRAGDAEPGMQRGSHLAAPRSLRAAEDPVRLPRDQRPVRLPVLGGAIR